MREWGRGGGGQILQVTVTVSGAHTRYGPRFDCHTYDSSGSQEGYIVPVQVSSLGLQLA